MLTDRVVFTDKIVEYEGTLYRSISFNKKNNKDPALKSIR
jgi:hypothetical protein